MGQKRISKKELKCIDGHLSYSIKALMRDSHSLSGDSLFIKEYDDKSQEVCHLLFKAFILVDELYEKSKD